MRCSPWRRWARFRASAAALVAAGAIAAGLGTTPVRAAQEAPDDWPCKQALVPELSYQLLWTGPSPKPYFDNWGTDGERAQLVSEVVRLAIPREAAKARMRSYLDRHAPIDEAAKAKIFAGLFQTIQDNRREAIAAIKTYSRTQQKALDRISELLRKLDTLLSADQPDQAAVQSTRQQLDITRQVFEERRQSIRALCEQPTLMEQRLGDLARTLQRTG